MNAIFLTSEFGFIGGPKTTLDGTLNEVEKSDPIDHRPRKPARDGVQCRPPVATFRLTLWPIRAVG